MAEEARGEPVWRARFRATSVQWVAIAPRMPARGIAVSNPTGVHQLYAWDTSANSLRLLVERPEGQQVGTISPDGGHVYFLDDSGGSEIGHYVRVPWTGGATEDISPDLPPYASFGITFSSSGNRLGFFGADSQGFTGYWADVDGAGRVGELHAFAHSTAIIAGPQFSCDGRLGAMTGSERGGRKARDVFVFDLEAGERVGELWDGPEHDVYAVDFQPLPDSKLLLLAANRSGDRRPELWDVRTGERQELALGAVEGEMTPVGWMLDGQGFLILCQAGAEQELYIYDLPSQSLLSVEHGGGTFTSRSQGPCPAPEREIWTVWSDAGNPPQIIALATEAAAAPRVLLPAGPVPPAHQWRSVNYHSTDGQEIQGWLSIPDGSGPFPAVIAMHGGPEAVQGDEWNPRGQAWVDAGFVHFSINFRGSVGFGPTFRYAIFGDLGRLELEDMAAARSWLISQGLAHSDQVFLTGWSYGGYLTLLGLGKQPDLWAGGMAGIAIADWAVAYEEESPKMRSYHVATMGGTPQQRPELHIDRSPITHAANVRAPVLAIQARNDTRTPARQMALYEARMRELGKTIEVHWFEGGHTAARADVEQAIAHTELMLRFARKIVDRKLRPGA